jgi:AcrR family transcriptional regulator
VVKFRLSRVASLLGEIRKAAARYHAAEAELERSREQLRAAMAAAREEGIPVARIAREAGVSRPTAHDWLKRKS